MNIDEESCVLQQRNQVLAAYCLLRSKKKRIWVRQLWRNREGQGHYHNLIQKMRLNDGKMYFNYLRMDTEIFDELLHMVGPSIQRKATHCREPLPAGMKLALTLRYLVTGASQADLSFNFRLGRSTVCKILEEVPKIFSNCLQPIALQMPDLPEKWENIADDFWFIWNFPLCLGAIDGKHCIIQCPPNSGSTFFNYKGAFSVVVMAVADASCSVMLISVTMVGKVTPGYLLNLNLARQF